MSFHYQISAEEEDPRGVKLIYSLDKTIMALLFPRDRLYVFNKMDESKRPGVYILYNSIDSHEKPHIYIGQSGIGVTSRLSSHNRKKDFWNQALVFVHKDNSYSMNGAHTKIIESKLIKLANSCGTVVMENAEESNEMPVQKSDKEYAANWTKEIITIVQLLGIDFFSEKSEKESSKSEQTEPPKKQKKQSSETVNLSAFPELPSDDMKPGVFVMTAMKALEKGHYLSDQTLDDLCLPEKTIGLTHREGLSLLIELKDGQGKEIIPERIRDRYWASEYLFSGRRFLIFSQWYKDGDKRRPWKSDFISFYNQLSGK